MNPKAREVWWAVQCAKTEAELNAEMAQIKDELTSLRHSVGLYTNAERELIAFGRFCKKLTRVLSRSL